MQITGAVMAALFGIAFNDSACETIGVLFGSSEVSHPGGNREANIKSISPRCYLREVVFE